MSAINPTEALLSIPIKDVTGSQTRKEPDSARINKACQDFEALFMNYMLKVMRECGTEDTGGLSLGTNNPFQSMFDWEMAQQLSQQSPLGISEALLRQIGVNEDDSGKALNTRLDFDAVRLNRMQPAMRHAIDRYSRFSTSAELDDIILRAAGQFDLDPNLIRAVVRCESGGDTNAVSPKGAKGLMQLMDATANELGVRDPFDPEQNIFGGAAYLRQMLNRYQGNPTLALAAYNAGPAAVDKNNGVPPYKETEEYIRRVMDQYQSQEKPKTTEKSLLDRSDR